MILPCTLIRGSFLTEWSFCFTRFFIHFFSWFWNIGSWLHFSWLCDKQCNIFVQFFSQRKSFILTSMKSIKTRRDAQYSSKFSRDFSMIFTLRCSKQRMLDNNSMAWTISLLFEMQEKRLFLSR